MLKQTTQIVDHLLRRATGQLTRAANTPARARPGLVRAEFECLESRSMLSLATADDGFASKPDVGWLPTPDYSDISILPIRSIDDGARPWPPSYPSLPPPPYEPYLPPSQPPPSELPDDADVGGFTEIDNSDKSDPGILVGPASDKITREVQQMLDSLLYVPKAHDSDAQPTPPRTRLSTQDAVSSAVNSSGSLDDLPDGGMIALAHDAVILHSLASDPAPADDIDSWLSIPVRMDSAPGKFQAFEVSTGEAQPSPAPPPPVNEALFLTPRNSLSELVPPAAGESTLPPSTSVENAAAIDQAIAETIDNLPSSPAAPPEQSNKNSSARPAAAAAIFVFLAVRAARAARTTDTAEPHSQTTWTLRRPARPDR